MTQHNPHWRRQMQQMLLVPEGMGFREKQEELTVLGAAYKFLYLDGAITRIEAPDACVDIPSSQELIRARGQRITQSLSPSEVGLAGLLSPARRAAPVPLPPSPSPFRRMPPKEPQS